MRRRRAQIFEVRIRQGPSPHSFTPPRILLHFPFPRPLRYNLAFSLLSDMYSFSLLPLPRKTPRPFAYPNLSPSPSTWPCPPATLFTYLLLLPVVMKGNDKNKYDSTFSDRHCILLLSKNFSFLLMFLRFLFISAYSSFYIFILNTSYQSWEKICRSVSIFLHVSYSLNRVLR